MPFLDINVAAYLFKGKVFNAVSTTNKIPFISILFRLQNMSQGEYLNT